MGRYSLRLVLQAIPTLLGVSVLVFILVRLTGDPAAVMLPPDAPEAEIEAFRQRNGLDKPILVQYAIFLGQAVQGEFGNSIRYQIPVTDLLAQRIPSTLQLTAASLGLGLLVGLPLGLLAGLRKGSRIDKLSRSFALLGQAVPSFYLGLLLILVFGVWLEVLPTVGNDGLSSLILPSVTLAMFLMPLVLRITRGSILDVVRQDYVRTARSKGISDVRVLNFHMLKNSLIPVVTIVGLALGAALSGAVVTETVFSWPGIGRLLVDAIATRDYPVVQGIVVFASAAFVAVNLLVDLAYARLDPRIRLR